MYGSSGNLAAAGNLSVWHPGIGAQKMDDFPVETVKMKVVCHILKVIIIYFSKNTNTAYEI